MSSPRNADRNGGRNQRQAGRDGQHGSGGKSRRDGGTGPRPPVKGRRRTFDTESVPNERERRRDDVGSDDRTGDRWIDEGPVRRAAGDAVRRGSSNDREVDGQKAGKNAPTQAGRRPRKQPGKQPGDQSGKKAGKKRGGGQDRNAKRSRERAAKRAESALELDRDRLVRQVGQAKAERAIQRLGEASEAFADERFEDANRLLKPIAATMPDEPAVRELYGLTLYRLGRWRQAVTELEAFHRRTGSAEQHPVLADCRRALGHHRKVAELWDELGSASPDAAIVAEGRIVYAGSLADQGDLVGAIKALEGGALGAKKLAIHHLRMRYALGDLYERAGEHQAARRQFQAVAEAEPAFFDVQDRLAQL
ncbi:MAG: hypothetical protein U5K30_14780 [Acidimicrobiales bacterium]|nr:hypothetical protein [Acidimicrobiales bacterium]